MIDATAGPTQAAGLVTLVWRALRVRRALAAVSACGLSITVLLVLVIFASYRSVEVAVRAYVAQPGIALWIAPRGTDNLVRSASLLPDVVREDVAAMRGVRRADPVLRSFVTAEPLVAPARPRARAITLLAIGCSMPSGLGGPPRLVAGRNARDRGEVVLDRAAAHRLGVKIGEPILLDGRRFDVAGLSARTNLVSTQLVFLDATAAADLSGYRDSTSFVAVGLQPGRDAAEVARAIEEAFPGVDVHSREEFAARSVHEVFAGFRPIQALVSAIGLLAAGILVLLLVQSALESRRRDLAVLIALGASARTLAGVVVAQAMGLVLGGVVIGTVAAVALADALDRWVPSVELAPRALDGVEVLAAFAVAGAIGALVPVARLGRIDPAEVFRP